MITNDDIGWLRARWPTAAAVVLLLVTLALLDATQRGTGQTDSIVQPWVVLAAGLVYPVVGLGRRVLRDGRTVLVQSLGLLVFAGVTLLGYAAGPFTAYVVAAGLIAHAGWDAVHHRRNAVVWRWYAELCAVYDLLLATAVLTAATL
ncbi:hypothetical protein [Microlunatus parietis]|uniref:Uncharacterized protein n=1 Tax=Microlunatus parietis TaxID=682979 RepID=A0A7Y9LBN4_9ACTN|nr:hypothetical protein [Microlunatus parietis]NYE70830.1 hypothetical protein [Microlunatus parietis]